MRIVLLGSGSIFVNLSGSSPNLKIFEAHYGLWGNIVASINSRLMKNGVNKVLFYDLCKHYLPILVLSRQYLFGSSTFSVWFRKRAARAANNSHVCLQLSSLTSSLMTLLWYYSVVVTIIIINFIRWINYYYELITQATLLTVFC